MIKVEYRFEGEEMTDEQWENQEEKTFTITKDMVVRLIEMNTEIPKGLELDLDNIYVK